MSNVQAKPNNLALIEKKDRLQDKQREIQSDANQKQAAV